jgi:hypothetical protein
MNKIYNTIITVFILIILCNCAKQQRQNTQETFEYEQVIETFFQNDIETPEFTQDTSILTEEDLFIRKNIYLNFSSVLDKYNNSINVFSNIFVNNPLKILLGDKDLLNIRLDFFSLAQMDNQNLRFIKNMIFAKYGYKFTSLGLFEYFSRFDWYEPKYNNVDNYLTEIDMYNIQLLQMFETRNEELPDIILDNPVGVWQILPPMRAPDGWYDRFIILPNNIMEYHETQMQDFKTFIGMIGSYTITGNVLTYFVTEVYYIYFIPDVFSIYQNRDLHISTNGVNKITLEKPIIFKFPISNIETLPKEDEIFDNYRKQDIYVDEVDTLRIGGRYFFKFFYDENAYIRNWR